MVAYCPHGKAAAEDFRARGNERVTTLPLFASDPSVGLRAGAGLCEPFAPRLDALLLHLRGEPRELVHEAVHQAD
eukprot:8167164-Lingulodinium_polyedra.AAC.1